MRARAAFGPRTAVVLVAAFIGLGAAGCIPDTGPPPLNDPYQTPLFNATNADRASNGLAPLTFSPKVSVLAGGHACDMARVGYLFHTDLAATLSSGDYSAYSALGENIIVAPPGTPPLAMEAAWMGSALHRDNILNPAFDVVGINVCIGGDGRMWGTVDFGRL
jgi:uncharacterized protein YkwD